MFTQRKRTKETTKEDSQEDSQERTSQRHTVEEVGSRSERQAVRENTHKRDTLGETS